MCVYTDDFDEMCTALQRTDEGAVTACCGAFIADDMIGHPQTRSVKYIAVCDECGVIKRNQGGTSFVKTAVKEHDDSHNANWGRVR